MKSFFKFKFNNELLKAIERAGFENPTAIQSEVIPHVLDGKDLIAKAQTGSGKTAAFCLPALELIANDPNNTILILTPTRELAIQVCAEMEIFSKNFQIIPTAIYGGEGISHQLKRLKRDDRIIVGTPGRLLDLFRSKHLSNFAPKLVVLDEADEMLNMGFLDDVELIFNFLPKDRQTLLFSATIPNEVKKVSKKFLKNPTFVDASSEKIFPVDIEQTYYLVPEFQRKNALLQILQFINPQKSIIFCNTKRQVDELFSELISLNFSALCLHGDMSQQDRLRSIEKFRKSDKKILVATDVAGRGINVMDITHVFNYELPYSIECYTHRIGRTGRMGNKGVSITLVTPKQKYILKKFVQDPSKKPEFANLPSQQELQAVKQRRFIEQLKNEELHINSQELFSSLKNHLSLEEMILKLISMHLNKTEVSDNKTIFMPSDEREKSKRSFKGRSHKRENRRFHKRKR